MTRREELVSNIEPLGMLRRTAASLFFCALVALPIGCGQPNPRDRPLLPTEITDFQELFSMHCSGCHGSEGKYGPAPPLNDRLLLAILPRDEMRQVVAMGREGSLMPAFAVSHGGPLTPDQIEIVVGGIVDRWAGSTNIRKELLPSYDSPDRPPTKDDDHVNDIAAGSLLFARYCAECHGAEGRGQRALNNPALLALLSDQALRRLILTGRPDLGMPDYFELITQNQGDLRTVSRQVDQLVAYLAQWREPMEPQTVTNVSRETKTQ